MNKADVVFEVAWLTSDQGKDHYDMAKQVLGDRGAEATVGAPRRVGMGGNDTRHTSEG